MSVSEPGKIITPWAESGLKNTIPPAANPATGRAGFDQGFSAINMTAKEAGGIPPFGQDFNGIFYEVTNILRYMQAGGQPTFDAALATAIGGYPKGAVLLSDDGLSIFKSSIDSNLSNPNENAASWIVSSVSGNRVGSTQALINSGVFSMYPEGYLVVTNGFYSEGDGGGATWVKTGVTGLAPSQSPGALATGLLSDASGAQWKIVGDRIFGEMLGAKGDNPGFDDRPYLFALYNHALATGVVGRLKNKTYHVSSNLAVNNGTKGFTIYGDGKSVIKRNAAFAGNTMRVANTNYTRLAGFIVDANESGFAGSTVGLDIVNCSKSFAFRVEARNTGTNGMWAISGINAITFYDFHFVECTAEDVGDSGIQIQGASASGMRACSARRMNLADANKGTGIYFKVPVRDCYMGDCYVEDAINGFTVGSSFPTAIAQRLQYSNLRAYNVSCGLRFGSTVDSTVTGIAAKLNPTPATGLGDLVRMEGGSHRNTITGIKADGVSVNRGAIRFFGDASRNTASVESFTNPAPGAVIARFADTSDYNSVEISQGFTPPSIEVLFQSSGLYNTYKIRNVARAQGEQFIISDTLTVDDIGVSRIQARGAGSAADNLSTITPGVDGQTLVVTNFLSSAPITVDSTGNIELSTVTFVLANERQTLTLMWSSRINSWIEVARSVNL